MSDSTSSHSASLHRPGRLLDPRADLVFKKVFGNDPDLVKSFLNSVLPLPDDGLIDTVEYLTSEQVPRTPLQKFSIVDVRCKDQHGRIFIVEMQMGWSESFRQRIQFGASKAYVEQLKPGETYNLLNPVYGLALIGDTFDLNTEEWYHHYKMLNVKNTNKVIEGLELILVELPKFKATSSMERKLGILWLRFLNETAGMTEIPAEFECVPEISRAIDMVNEASYTKEELAHYDGFLDQVRSEKTLKEDAKNEGREEGLVEGMEKGREEGLVEGEAIGMEKGALNERRLMAIEMLNDNESDAKIIKYARITPAELAEIKASMGQ